MSMGDSFKDPMSSISKDEVEKTRGENLASLEEILFLEFSRRTFVIVEDEFDFQKRIARELKAKRRVNKDQEDTGVILVANYEDFVVAINNLFSLDTNAPSNLTIILDLRFPDKKDGAIMNNGKKASDYISSKVADWNSSHPDRQVFLEIIINSSSISNIGEAKKLGAISFGEDKFGDKGPISALEALFRKSNPI